MVESAGKALRLIVAGVLLLAAIALVSEPAPSEASSRDPEVALFDPATGQWHLRYAAGTVESFFYGVPDDSPLMGDWDCDGTDSVAMYRETTGFVYYRNSNDFGMADGSFFFGIPGDIPISGDWNNDGCDTFGIYRNGKVFYRNKLSTGFAALAYWFGVPGDQPFAGDFNGDGWDTVGLYRPSTGFAYLTNAVPAHESVATTHSSFFYGIPGDRILAGDWDADGDDTVGIYRPSTATFYLSNVNQQGNADLTLPFGSNSWLPTAGDFTGPIRTFGDGVYVVGSDIQPGTFRAASFSGSCYWERLSGFGGTFDEIIANEFTTIPQVVTIESSDAGFESDGCGTWTSDLSPITPGPWIKFGDGVYIVGTTADVAPGTWRGGVFSGSCYWERISGFGGTFDEIEANEFTSVRQIVTIQPGDAGFETEGCGEWTRDLTPITTSPTAPFGDGMYFVESEIAAGTWRSRGDFTASCYWERLSGFSGDFSELIANDFTNVAPIVTIAPTDAGFHSDGCGTWDRIS